MKILFTAFKGIGNTSFQLINQLGCDSLLLTNSFSGLEKDINSIEEAYDMIYMFRVDKDLYREIKIERCAKCDDNTIYTEFDVQALSAQITTHQITHRISNTPTRYLCNSAYYHMLCKNKNALFIHIPSAKGMDDNLMRQLIKLFRNIVHLI